MVDWDYMRAAASIRLEHLRQGNTVLPRPRPPPGARRPPGHPPGGAPPPPCRHPHRHPPPWPERARHNHTLPNYLSHSSCYLVILQLILVLKKIRLGRIILLEVEMEIQYSCSIL